MGKPLQKKLTIEDRKLIEKYIKKGYSCCETSRIIGRSKSVVIREVKEGGGINYSAKEAQDRAIERDRKRYTSLSERNKGKSFNPTYQTRIENLEMQVEILFETIKGILNK